MRASARMMTGWAGLSLLFVALVFIALAMCRPIDHDESQYIAAALLTAHGLLPYRDFAYLQAPLQPFAFAPLAAAAGTLAWPALRVANALLGMVAVAGVAGAARVAGACRRATIIAVGLFACCDILLFSIGTARNDALPVACLALALWLAVRDRARGEAVLTGLLLAAAAAAKISYALPAIACGGYAMWHCRGHRLLWLAIGAAPVAAFVGWTAALAPHGFVFGTLVFPATAPTDYYAATDEAWKLTVAAKVVDTLKFLALGPALLALAVVGWRRPRRWPTLVEWLILAGLLAAWLPTPTWRQYLLPLLPPLFVALALAWTRAPPGRALRIAACLSAGAGLAPSIAAVAQGGGMVEAMRQGAAIRRALDRARVGGPVATLAPEFLAATRRLPDARFATGPFFFRSRALVAPAEQPRLHVVSRATLVRVRLPAAILIGGEDAWTSGDPALDIALERRAAALGYQPVAVEGRRFRLWIAR